MSQNQTEEIDLKKPLYLKISPSTTRYRLLEEAAALKHVPPLEIARFALDKYLDDFFKQQVNRELTSG